MESFQALLQKGHSIIAIEHHVDVLKSADWLIDMGPEGGDKGGTVVATGTPEGVGHSRKPPLWMKPGDVLEVEITGIGVLRTRIVDEK